MASLRLTLRAQRAAAHAGWFDIRPVLALLRGKPRRERTQG
jgi:hypothetical protein